MKRVTFLVDGFNVYHSLVDAGFQEEKCLKWLDLHSLLLSYPNLIGGNPVLHRLHYFSALANHRLAQDPGVIERHQAYLNALESVGANIHLGRFKPCRIACKECGQRFFRYEEKETDVAIAVALMEAGMDSSTDTVVLVSGDSDLAPALRSARVHFPEKQFGVAFPFRRVSEELKRDADFFWRLKPQIYSAHQFPSRINLPDKGFIQKPRAW